MSVGQPFPGQPVYSSYSPARPFVVMRDEGIGRKVKHRKPNRIKASTSLSLVGAAAVVSLLGTPANAAPADPGAVPAAPGQQPGGTDGQPGATDGGQSPTTDAPIPPDPKIGSVPAPKPDTTKPDVTQPQQSQPGVTTPGSPKPDTTAPAGNAPSDGNAPKPDTQPAGVAPQQGPKVTQPGVTVPRVAPLPVPGQTVPAIPVQVPDKPNQQTIPAQVNPNQPAKPGNTQPDTVAPDQSDTTSVDTLTGQPTVQKPQWQSPAVDTAPAAPVVAMTGPHTEIGANVDGGVALPGWAANTHHFSNLDGYVGTIGYTTPGGTGEAGVSMDYTTVNQIKVTAFASAGAGDDRKLEFVLDSTGANAAKADAENFVRLLPGGGTILDALGQIGKLPEGDIPGQTTDVGGVTTQLGGSVQY